MDAISKENWKRCAVDLNVEIQIPFCVEINNQPIELMLFKNFGSQMGTLVFNSLNVLETIEKKGSNQIRGYNVSVFDCQLLQYDEEVRDSVIEMLAEWGWTGPEDEKPSWLLNDIDHKEDVS